MVQPDGATALMVGIYFDSAWPMLLETAYSIDVRHWCSLGITMQQRLKEVTRCMHALPNCLCVHQVHSRVESTSDDSELHNNCKQLIRQLVSHSALNTSLTSLAETRLQTKSTTPRLSPWPSPRPSPRTSPQLPQFHTQPTAQHQNGSQSQSPRLSSQLVTPRGLVIPIEQAVATLQQSHTRSRLDDQLLSAAQIGDASGVKQCLENGTDPNRVVSEDPQRMTPLLHAIASSRIKVVRMLLENRASPNMTNAVGVCPLVAAVENFPQQGQRNSGGRTICRLLLEFKADIERRNKSNRTVIEQAAMQGRPDIANMLMILAGERSR